MLKSRLSLWLLKETGMESMPMLLPAKFPNWMWIKSRITDLLHYFTHAHIIMLIVKCTTVLEFSVQCAGTIGTGNKNCPWNTDEWRHGFPHDFQSGGTGPSWPHSGITVINEKGTQVRSELKQLTISKMRLTRFSMANTISSRPQRRVTNKAHVLWNISEYIPLPSPFYYFLQMTTHVMLSAGPLAIMLHFFYQLITGSFRKYGKPEDIWTRLQYSICL